MNIIPYEDKMREEITLTIKDADMFVFDDNHYEKFLVKEQNSLLAWLVLEKAHK